MVGQFKDDRFQDHTHEFYWHDNLGAAGSATTEYCKIQMAVMYNYVNTTKGAYTGRYGDTTRVKSKGVKFIIKVL